MAAIRSNRGFHATLTSLSLAPYAGPWTRREARHLISRTHFGALKRDVDGALSDGSAAAASNRIVDDAISDPMPEPPSWYSGNSGTGVDQIYDLQRSLIDRMRTGSLIDKLSLLWHNHFPTQWGVNQAKSSYSIGHIMYDYYALVRTHSLGNFRTFVRKMGLNASMHYYLDGYVNERGQANENYARELLELFSMGQYAPDGSENYVEQDIKEIARALTGWVISSNRKTSFDATRHDNASKTFLGRSGNFAYDDVVDIIFETRSTAIAHFIARKLYTFLVHAIPDETVVAALAAEIVSNDFEIAPALRTLLASEHFYSSGLAGSRIKGPLEFIVGFLREAEVVPSQALLEEIREMLTPTRLGQELLNPPNVAGWPGHNPPDSSGSPGHHTWLTTSTLPDRWLALVDIIYGGGGTGYDPLEFVSKVSDPSDPFRIAEDVAQTLLAIPIEFAGVRDVSEPFAGDPSIEPPAEVTNGPAYRANLSKILLDGTPFYEWPLISDTSAPEHDDVRQLVKGYLAYLIQLPSYQLT